MLEFQATRVPAFNVLKKREDGQAGAGAPQLTRTGDERASPLVTGLWVVKENGPDSDAAISQQG